jgi:predicted nuclease of predicted toxin-antitoxin system
MNHNVVRAVTEGLRLRGVDVLTALEDGAHEMDDSDLLDRATALDRVLFSNDDDLATEARRRQRSGHFFSGVLFVRQGRVTIGQQIEQLELIAKASEPHELQNTLLFLWRS